MALCVPFLGSLLLLGTPLLVLVPSGQRRPDALLIGVFSAIAPSPPARGALLHALSWRRAGDSNPVGPTADVLRRTAGLAMRR